MTAEDCACTANIARNRCASVRRLYRPVMAATTIPPEAATRTDAGTDTTTSMNMNITITVTTPTRSAERSSR